MRILSFSHSLISKTFNNYSIHFFEKWLPVLNLKSSFYTSSLDCYSLTRKDVYLDHIIYNEKSIGHSPLIICHGLLGNKNNWRSLCKSMNTNSGRKIVSYDAINHGSSPHRENMSYDDMALDLLRLLDILNIEKAILIGHSMGGKTVMTTALRYPDRVEKLIVVDSSPTKSKSLSEALMYIQTMAGIDMSKITSRKMVEEILEKVIQSVSLRQFIMSNLVTSGSRFFWRVNLKALIENYHFIHSFPSFDDSSTYKNSTLFIGGGRSDYINEVEYPTIFNFFPNAEIVHIPDAGHWVHSEKPNEFLKIVMDFIK